MLRDQWNVKLFIADVNMKIKYATIKKKSSLDAFRVEVHQVWESSRKNKSIEETYKDSF